MWPDLTKPTIGHWCHRSCSLDWNCNFTTILNAKGASDKVSDGGFCQIRSTNSSRSEYDADIRIPLACQGFRWFDLDIRNVANLAGDECHIREFGPTPQSTWAKKIKSRFSCFRLSAWPETDTLFMYLKEGAWILWKFTEENLIFKSHVNTDF